ncbi:hypothetical protein [Streptomyces sp. TLI_146]|nr:hypothetical protein [Streptomyces sp. TLI_146]
MSGRTNGNSGSDQSEENDIPDTGQSDRHTGQNGSSGDDQMGGGAPSSK